MFQTDMLENTASQRSAFLAEIISPLVFSQENLYNSLGAFCFLLFDRIPGSCSLLMTVLYGQVIHSLKHEIHTKETTLIELKQEVSTLHVQLDSTRWTRDPWTANEYLLVNG